jgi:hypothetical protein
MPGRGIGPLSRFPAGCGISATASTKWMMRRSATMLMVMSLRQRGGTRGSPSIPSELASSPQGEERAHSPACPHRRQSRYQARPAALSCLRRVARLLGGGDGDAHRFRRLGPLPPLDPATDSSGAFHPLPAGRGITQLAADDALGDAKPDRERGGGVVSGAARQPRMEPMIAMVARRSSPAPAFAGVCQG